MTIIYIEIKTKNFIFILVITNFSPFCGAYANSADPDQTPFVASDQGLHCLLTELSI